MLGYGLRIYHTSNKEQLNAEVMMATTAEIGATMVIPKNQLEECISTILTSRTAMMEIKRRSRSPPQKNPKTSLLILTKVTS